MRRTPTGSTRSTDSIGVVAVMVAVLASWPGLGSSARAEPVQGQDTPPQAASGAADTFAALMVEVEQAWVSGRGRAYDARSSAERKARGREPGAFESLSVEVVPEVSPGSSLRTEMLVGVGVGVRLFGVGHRQRDAAARIALAEAESMVGRLRFAEAVFAAYGEWAAVELHARHLVEHIGELERDLAPLREAVANRLFDGLTLETLEVEVVRLGLELESARTTASHAAASLSVLLGKTLDPASLGPLMTEAPPSHWHEVATDQHPESMRLSAEARRERTAAEVARRSDDPLLSVSATLRRVGDPDESFVFGGVAASLTVPLSRAGGAEAERLAGRAVALSEARELHGRTFALELAQRERQYERWLGELAKLRTDAEPRLLARVERTAAAMQKGRATASDLILARRDLIELHHDEVALVGRLVASGLMSRFWRDALGRGVGDGR